ncbi:zinc finger protein castor homolog 1-like [Macrobrachium rosenbergii]|uniref:zinc finger protein castor homolog 1-like n=1 Tax=Macrobrachium rosenbergii TaxID=79674 RepID=UPI0034D570BC
MNFDGELIPGNGGDGDTINSALEIDGDGLDDSVATMEGDGDCEDTDSELLNGDSVTMNGDSEAIDGESHYMIDSECMDSDSVTVNADNETVNGYSDGIDGESHNMIDSEPACLDSEDIHGNTDTIAANSEGIVTLEDDSDTIEDDPDTIAANSDSIVTTEDDSDTIVDGTAFCYGNSEGIVTLEDDSDTIADNTALHHGNSDGIDDTDTIAGNSEGLVTLEGDGDTIQNDTAVERMDVDSDLNPYSEYSEEGSNFDGENKEDSEADSLSPILRLYLKIKLGKLLESLKNNSVGAAVGVDGASAAEGEPPTPPRTPLRENAHIGSPMDALTRPPSALDSFHQHAFHARMLGGGGTSGGGGGGGNFSALLTLAALHEGKGMGGAPGGAGQGVVPLPPTLDTHHHHHHHHKSLPTTPTTPTSTGPFLPAVTPGLAGLSLGSGGGGGAPTLMQGGMGGVRDTLAKPQVDYSRYVKMYSSALECGSLSCREHNLRDHFHCLECDSKVFSKKEEMIRHFKWHKKRDESLQHGFMRYSPSDDCSDRFSNCSHNRKQTHYHCLKEGCDKVYISTSDVQMHANYHRKDSAIMQEGFQRFRASEDCGQAACSFSGQRTTHFHCMRSACNYTFKNKADMEKHKTYHIKDEQLTKDGFKKFMKQEDCPYEGCKFSRVVNHIHCIRPECNYVLHSSGQIFAHKVHFNTLLLHLRKHERQDHERAYRKYKLAQTMLGVPEGHPALTPLLHEALRPLGSLGGPMINPLMGPLGGPLAGGALGSHLGGPLGGHMGGGPMDQRNEDSSSPLGVPQPPGTPGALPPGIQRPQGPLLGSFAPPGLVESQQHPLARLLGVGPPPAAHGLFPGGSATSSASTPASSSSGPASPVDLSISMGAGAGGLLLEDRDWERWVRFYGREDVCKSGGCCDLSGIEHYHCDECETVFRGRESARDHGRVHEQQALVTEDHYTRVSCGDDATRACPPDCPIQEHADHYHCNWEGCGEGILASGDKPFRRLEHFRMHDYTRRLAMASSPGGAAGAMGVAAITSVDAMFKRKRGRPPKNRIIEVWNDYLPVSANSSHDSPQAIFTSFKLPKSSPPPPTHGPLGMLPLGHLHHPHPHPLTSSASSLGHHLSPHLKRDSASPPGLSIPMSISSAVSSVSGQPVILPLSGPLTSNPLQPQAEVMEGFYVWSEGSTCPDQLCPLLGRRHYHCVHPRCLYVTAHVDVLPLHAHDFHDNTQILEGFIAIDRNIDCRSPNCQSNKINKHFHCTRCGFSFVRYQMMESHAEKHLQEEGSSGQGHSLGPQSPIYLKRPRPDSPMETPTSAEGPNKSQDVSPPVVKSAGIFYPLSPFPTSTSSSSSSGLGGAGGSGASRGEAGALVTPIPPSSSSSSLRPHTSTTFTLPVSGSLTITATRRSPPIPHGLHSSSSSSPPPPPPTIRDQMEQGEADDFDADQPRPLSQSGEIIFPSPSVQISKHDHVSEMVKSEHMASLASSLGAEWLGGMDQRLHHHQHHHPQYGPDFSCGRPFCKLKKKDHYHCHVCNQAFSEHDKLRPHLLKHATGSSPLNPGSVSAMTDDDSESRGAGEQDDEDGSGSFHPKAEGGGGGSSSCDRPIGSSSPGSPNESVVSISTSSPLPFGSGVSIGGGTLGHSPSQFPLVYTQAASFPGLPSPFAPQFGISGMFPGTLPRLLPPTAWQFNPALAAMAQQGLMIPGVRPNGELATHGSPGAGGPGLGAPVLQGPGGEHNPILPATLGTSPHLALLGKRIGADDFNSQEAKKIRNNHSMRMLKDEPVPEGYLRFRSTSRFNEDCQYPHCGYREHQTHFHCMRKDCGYSFCDKTRFVQHTARHERLDTLMGGDFNQYRSNVSCGRPDCVYASMIGQQQNKASHFHCLKCDFVCTDTNKVVAHRRQHQKRDSINAAGFEKFTPSQPCGIQGCNHNQKQTHYHCLKCQYSVLGLSQMSAHRFRHLE